MGDGGGAGESVGGEGGGREVVPQDLSASQELSQKEVQRLRSVYLETYMRV